MKKKFIALTLWVLISQSALASGVGLSSTRVIYDGNKKEASLTVQNKNKSEEFLIQSWVDDATGSKKHHSSLLRHYSNLSQEKTTSYVL